MVRIAVCDDDIREAERIGGIVEECCRKEKEICWSRIYNDSMAFFYEAEEGEKYDILLLDIGMPGMNGIELAAKIRAFLPDAIIIFVTSREQYVYKVFEVQPFRFVPKRLMGEMLGPALRDALRLAADREGAFYLAESPNVLEKISIRSITHIWHREKYAYIEKNDGKNTKVRKSLKEIYRRLPGEEFVWLDRGCIVNLAQVQRISKEGVLLTTGTLLYIGRERLKELKERLRSYWIGKGSLQGE